eukprot:SAG22_NODE_9814_length_568_cov_0.940299_1_plen_141_part_10
MLARTKDGRQLLDAKLASGDFYPENLSRDFQATLATKIEKPREDRPPGKLVVVIGEVKGLVKPSTFLGLYPTMNVYLQVCIGEEAIRTGGEIEQVSSKALPSLVLPLELCLRQCLSLRSTSRTSRRARSSGGRPRRRTSP